MPRKPQRVAVQRRRRNTSPSTTTESTAAKIGAVKPSAVTWETGVMPSALKKANMAQTLSPARRNQGRNTMSPKKFRKKTIWIGSSAPDR